MVTVLIRCKQNFVKFRRAVFEICERADRQIAYRHRQADGNNFLPAGRGEVKTQKNV